MANFLIILTVIASILLVGFVLIQNSKGGGLAAGFASANSVFGVRKTTDKIEKLTWILVGVIVVLSVFSTKIMSNGTTSAISEISTEALVPTTTNTVTPQNAVPTTEQQPEQQ